MLVGGVLVGTLVSSKPTAKSNPPRFSMPHVPAVDPTTRIFELDPVEAMSRRRSYSVDPLCSHTS